MSKWQPVEKVAVVKNAYDLSFVVLFISVSKKVVTPNARVDIPARLRVVCVASNITLLYPRQIIPGSLPAQIIVIESAHHP